MTENTDITSMLLKLSRGMTIAFQEMDRRLQALESRNSELIQQNKKQQLFIEKFLESPEFLAKQELEVHDRAAYYKVIKDAGHTKNPELISELASRLWKWASNLRSNLLKTKGASHFVKAVGSLGGGYSQDIADGERDDEIIRILAKYFREAAVTDLPEDFASLVTQKIEVWRIPFEEAASSVDLKMETVIGKWKGAINAKTPSWEDKETEESQSVDPVPNRFEFLGEPPTKKTKIGNGSD